MQHHRRIDFEGWRFAGVLCPSSWESTPQIGRLRLVEAYSYTFRNFVGASSVVNRRIKAYSDLAMSSPC